MLTFCYQNGQIKHVTQTDRKLEKKCICCNNDLTMKCGKIKIHHFAHKEKCDYIM